MTEYTRKAMEEIMESKPMKRLFAIELTAIITGRAEQYTDENIKEVIASKLESLATAIEDAIPPGEKIQYHYIESLEKEKAEIYKAKILGWNSFRNKLIENLRSRGIIN